MDPILLSIYLAGISVYGVDLGTRWGYIKWIKPTHAEMRDHTPPWAQGLGHKP